MKLIRFLEIGSCDSKLCENMSTVDKMREMRSNFVMPRETGSKFSVLCKLRVWVC